MAITLDFPGDAQTIINKIKNVVLSNNGEFNGDEKSGHIKIKAPIGKVEANYNINSSQITFNIINKPFFISEEMIKGEIVKYLQYPQNP